MTLALISGFVFVLFVAALFASFIIPRRSGAPYLPTPSRAIKEALMQAGLKPGEKFYDLGAGTAPAIIMADKAFGARAVGFEISPIIYAIAKIKLFLNRSNAELRFESLFNADLRDADVVFSFLAKRVMQKVEDKLKKELRPGARVICYTFGLPTLTPDIEIPIRGGWKILIYRMPGTIQEDK